MRIAILSILLVLGGSFFSSRSLAQPLPVKEGPSKPDTLKFTPTALGVEEVVKNMLNALGADSLKKVKDRTSVGTFAMHVSDKDGLGSLMTVEEGFAARADRMVIVGKQIEHIIDGAHSWRTDSNGAFYEITGDALKSDLAQAIFNPQLHLHDKNVVTALLGTAEVDSIGKCYVLKVQFQGVYPSLWYISAKSWLIVQIAQPVEGKLLWQKFSDFKVVDGVTYPFAIDVSGVMKFAIRYDHIRHNTNPDPATFIPSH